MLASRCSTVLTRPVISGDEASASKPSSINSVTTALSDRLVASARAWTLSRSHGSSLTCNGLISRIVIITTINHLANANQCELYLLFYNSHQEVFQHDY